MTARLLLALTALYVERPIHSLVEQQQYVELALRLIDKVDAATREKVADILRDHSAAPHKVCARLGLAPAPGVVSEHTPAQAPSPDMSRPTPAGPEAAAAAAHPVEASGAPPASPEPAQLGAAFFSAPSAERRRLLSLIARDGDAGNLPAEPQDMERLFAGLDTAAIGGRIGEFVREMERLLVLPKSLCERILNDGSGEPMVVVAKAANMPIAVLQRILLLVNPAVSHSVQRVFDLTDLYHELDRGAAIKLVALWRAEAKAHEPVAATEGEATARKPLRDASVGGIRSRFGTLTERVQSISPRPDRGSASRRDLRSR